MSPIRATTHWITCTVVAQDDDAEPLDVEALLFDVPGLLLSEEHACGDGADVVFRTRVRDGADPYHAALRAILHAAAGSGQSVDIASLHVQQQELALAAVRSRPCAGCGPAHDPVVCSACEPCLMEAAEVMLFG